MRMPEQSHFTTVSPSPEDLEEQGLRILVKIIARELARRRKVDQGKISQQKQCDPLKLG